MELSVVKNNPILTKNHSVESLDHAYSILLDFLEKYISEKNLDPEVASEIMKLTKQAYVELKSTYYLESKLSTFSDFLNTSMCFALKSKEGENNVYTDMFYFKHSKHLLTNG